MSKHPLEFESDIEVKGEIRDQLDELVESHGLPTVFWSLDSVYDEFDSQMSDAISEYNTRNYGDDE